MAQVQRRTTSGGEIATPERRKSGIFFFNRGFKKSLTPIAEVDFKQAAGPNRHRLKKPRPLDARSRVDKGREQTRPRPKRQVSLPLSSNPPFPEPRRSSSTCSRSASYSNKDKSSSPGSKPTTPGADQVQNFELKRSASGQTIPALAQTSTVTAEAEGVLSSSPKSASLSLGEATQKPAVEVSAAIPSEELPTPPQTPARSTEHAATSEAGENEEPKEAAASTSEQEPEVAPKEAEALEEEAPEEPEVPEVKKVSYHVDADLDIKVREADGVEAIYSVRSSALENSSSILKQSISSQTPTTTLDLTSEPASGLDVIFSIAHYKFQDVPQQVDGTQIHDISLVAEKYQTLHLLLPFLKSWLAALPSPAADAEKAIVTGWILGQAEWFAQAICQAANVASVSADGTLLDAQGLSWAEKPVSSEVVELIALTRTAAIERIVKAVSSPMTKLLNPEEYPEEDIRYCHAPGEDAANREECEQLQLGSAIMGLTKARLWPAPEASRIRSSPVELAHTYKEVRMRRYQTPGLRFQEDAKDAHAECGFGHHDEIQAILNEPVTLPAAIVEQLEVRAKKAGL